MTKVFIAATIRKSTEITGLAADKVAGALIEAIVGELKSKGKFTLPVPGP